MPFVVLKSDLALKYVSKLSDRVPAVDSGLRPDPPDLLVLLGLRHGKVRLQDRHPGLLLRLPRHHDRPPDRHRLDHGLRPPQRRRVPVQGNHPRLLVLLLPRRRLSTGIFIFQN